MEKKSLYSNDFPVLGENDYFKFPDVNLSNPDGILAIGGNLSPGVLLSAYKQGIFPWYTKYEPILWWSPDPRFVLFPENLHISKSAGKKLKKAASDPAYRFTMDTDFKGVISFCKSSYRKGQKGTWITDEMVEAYINLHELGYAHSVELWKGDTLAGGLYGVSLGNCFFGESMFSRESSASKLIFIKFINYIKEKGFYLIDCQVYTPYLESLGAVNIPRSQFLKLLKEGLLNKTFKGNWHRIFNDFL
jgi:leucyl/phenylalanyl-tRNA---protein transferase